MKKNRLLLLILLIVGLVVFLLALGIGTINLSLGQVLKGLFINVQSSERLIIWQTRFPRILLGGLVGVSLAIAGSLLQTLMHNKLASPSTIGITSGASFFGYLILVVFPTLSYLLPLATIVGSLLTTILIYFLGYKKGQGPIRIILAGLAVSTLFGAFNDVIKTFFADALGNASSFLVGGLNGITWSSFWLFIPYFMVALLVILFLPLRLDVLSLGDDRAKALGLNTNLLRFITIIIVALLVGSSVAVAGLISFVGLIVPHIARILVGSKHKYLLPCSAFLGFILVILCDLIGRVILPTAEVPVGIILALLGAPFFLFLLFRRKERY